MGMAIAVESPGGLVTSCQDPVETVRAARAAAAAVEDRLRREMVEKSIVCGYGDGWRAIQSGRGDAALIPSRSGALIRETGCSIPGSPRIHRPTCMHFPIDRSLFGPRVVEDVHVAGEYLERPASERTFGKPQRVNGAR